MANSGKLKYIARNNHLEFLTFGNKYKMINNFLSSCLFHFANSMWLLVQVVVSSYALRDERPAVVRNASQLDAYTSISQCSASQMK
jgi:hypothetical protein